MNGSSTQSQNDGEKDTNKDSRTWFAPVIVGIIATAAFLVFNWKSRRHEEEGSSDKQVNFPNPQQVEKKPKTENPPNPPFVATTERRPENKEEPEKTWKDLKIWGKFERVIRVIEFVAIIGGIPFVLFQGCEIRKSTNAAVVQAQLMQGQLNEMQKTRVEDERAWVTPFEMTTNSIEDTNYISFIVKFKNTGKTPALKISASSKTGVGTFDVPGDFSKLPQNQSFMLAPDAIFWVESTNIPKQQFEAISKIGGIGCAIYGRVVYDDVYGRHHWTDFDWASLGGKFMALPFQNSCDDAQTNHP